MAHPSRHRDGESRTLAPRDGQPTSAIIWRMLRLTPGGAGRRRTGRDHRPQARSRRARRSRISGPEPCDVFEKTPSNEWTDTHRTRARGTRSSMRACVDRRWASCRWMRRADGIDWRGAPYQAQRTCTSRVHLSPGPPRGLAGAFVPSLLCPGTPCRSQGYCAGRSPARTTQASFRPQPHVPTAPSRKHRYTGCPKLGRPRCQHENRHMSA